MENIHVGWKTFFDDNKDLIKIILDKVYEDDKLTIYPNKDNIFKTLFYFPPEEIKLVLLGQDCYHGFEILEGIKYPQACGLAFSVNKKIKKIPPSLLNIYKELKNCYNDFIIPTHGSLKRWIKEEKILLLNSALTVIEKTPNSHAHLWMQLTDKLIKYISEKNNKTIFLLLGAFAQKKETLIDINKHKIFKCVHPSPLSASRGFIGSKIFKQINEYLIDTNEEIINWNI